MNIDVSGDASICWSYPNIYARNPDTNDPLKLSRIVLSLEHVRAANSIAIEYDGARDGWVIRMDKTKFTDHCAETVEEGVEVAFIPAWNEAA